MGKRSDFKRIPKDFYPTPLQAVIPLIEQLKPCSFIEPCVGQNHLKNILEDNGFSCIQSFDEEGDATISKLNTKADCVITNPPWSRKLMHPIIENCSNQLPSWFLFDADWVHTQQSRPFLPRLRKIISVGRVKWIEDSKMTGKDNCAWHLFDKIKTDNITHFIGRREN